MTDLPPLTALTEKQRERALERFQAIRPFLKEGVPLVAIARNHSLPLRTLENWVRAYRERGLAGLSRKPRADDGGHRSIPDELLEIIEGLALRSPPPSIAYIHRQVSAIASDRGWKAPSYGTVYSVVSAIDPALITLAHRGSKAYQQAHDLILRREAKLPNELWQADHTELDIWLLDEHDLPRRPWLTAILDDYSRAVPGYYLSFSAPSSANTMLALHQAIWRKEDPKWRMCGVPGHLLHPADVDPSLQ